MSKTKIPETKFVGNITINGNIIPCAVVIINGEAKRLLIQREIVGLLTGSKKGGFDRYLQPSKLQPYIPDKFKNKPLSESTINFKNKGKSAQGFEATDLIDLCKMYIDARTAKVFLPSQDRLVEQAEAIIMAFAKTGVIAVIDEATGYQDIRDREALNKILETYLNEEAARWAKKFPNEFYMQIFRLNGWAYNPTTVKRPSVIGKWTKKLIYARFPEGVLEKLADLNLPTEKGYREHKHHQFLTEDIGNPKLKTYIDNVIFLMKSSPNWKQFMRAFARATGQSLQSDMYEKE